MINFSLLNSTDETAMQTRFNVSYWIEYTNLAEYDTYPSKVYEAVDYSLDAILALYQMYLQSSSNLPRVACKYRLHVIDSMTHEEANLAADYIFGQDFLEDFCSWETDPSKRFEILERQYLMRRNPDLYKN